MNDLAEDGQNLYKKLQKKYDTKEEIICVLAVATFCINRQSSIQDIALNNHLSDKTD